MEKIASYTFLPWSRRGIASAIKEKENFEKSGTPGTSERASVELDVKIKRSPITGSDDVKDIQKKVRLFGPGDIIGIDPKTIIRMEPNDGVTNFEFNYLPYIEFYEEDLPWRYTPASVNDSKPGNVNFDKRLRPWLALLVYEETEIRFEKFIPNAAPLPHVTILTEGPFSKDDEYWAWAHVQVNQGLDEMNNSEVTISDELDKLVKAKPNHACSRLLCPRKLKPNTKYHALLVPAYEKGRLAGRKAEAATIDAAPSQQYSKKSTGTEMPYYHNWSFRTSADGDFEELVRRLEFMAVDEKVGRRPMDISAPGYALEYDGNEELKADEDFKEQKGAIYIEGALRPPEVKTNNFAKSSEASAQTMVTKLQKILNLDSEMIEEVVSANIADDPIITPPIYGRWHNAIAKVSSGQPDRWINHLNLDPRQRAAAGIGTKVIKEHQEAYMDRAWGQFDGIREANRKLREAQYVLNFSGNLFRKKISRLSNERLVLGTTALHSRIRSQAGTLKNNVKASRLSDAVAMATFRKIARPKGVVKAAAGPQKALVKELLLGSNTGKKLAAVRYDSVAVAADSDVGKMGKSLGNVFKVPPTIDVNPKTFENTTSVIAGTTATTATTASTATTATVATTATPAARASLLPKIGIAFENDTILIQQQGEVVKQKKFVDIVSDKEYLVSQVIFGLYLKSENWTTQAPGKQLNISSVASNIKEQLRPETIFTKRVLNRLSFGDAAPKPKKEEIAPIYAAPQFDDAMYEPLEELSSEFLLPNLHLIKNNSVSILETNQEFIESYMVGLNHEFSRELFWREFLTDRRGSYFRQFWDVSGNPNFNETDSNAFRDSLRDIEEIHLWKNGKLGTNHPDKQIIKNRLVLVIRGDLLRKYPNTIITLHEAQFENPKNADINIPRKLNPKGKELFPAFEAKIAPDIYFFGFNISVSEARGNLESPDPGYFVVLKERIGEIHFGMDIKLDADATAPKYKPAQVFNNGVTGFESLLLKSRIKIGSGGKQEFNSWSTLSWEEFEDDLKFIELTKKPKSPTREEVSWGANAADMAYILYQSPFMMAIHVSKMVPEEGLNS